MSTIETTQTRILSPTRAMPRFGRYGRGAALITAASLLVYVAIEQFAGLIAPAVPSLLGALQVIYFVAVPLWALALAAVIADLRVIERANDKWLRVGLGAALVASLIALILDFGLFQKAGVSFQAPTYLVLYSSIGVALLTQKFVGRGAHILHGGLPWLSTVAGAAYVVAGIGYGLVVVPGIGMTAYMAGFNVLQIGQVVYLAWAIWMGIRLSRSKKAVSADLATR